MRTRPSYDDELLEPLPVVVDGVTFAPVSAAHARSLADAVPHAVEAIDAMCTKLVAAPGLAGLSPWLGPQPSALEARPPTPPTTFSRIFELHPALLESLPGWWQQHARNERVVIARRLSLRAPQRTDDGVWTMRASMRGPCAVRPVGMELTLWRHLGAWTRVTLEPRRPVYVKGLYFGTGHRALDALCDRLVEQLA